MAKTPPKGKDGATRTAAAMDAARARFGNNPPAKPKPATQGTTRVRPARVGGNPGIKITKTY